MAQRWRARHGIALQEAPETIMSSRHPFGFAWRNETVPPRPALASCRPAGEPAPCRVLGLPIGEFGGLADAVARARAVLGGARRKQAMVAQQAGQAGAAASGAGGPPDAGCIILRTESLIRAFMQDSTGGMLGTAARDLLFAPGIEALAARVAEGVGAFNALHLRVEPDMGLTEEELLPAFVESMCSLGFNASTPLYVASGLMSYTDSARMQHFRELLTGAGVCSRVVVKEDVLKPSELAGLHSEQLALIDLLVLSRAQKMVGTKRSAFSYMARELRLLRGRPRATSLLHPPQRDAVVAEAALELLPLDEGKMQLPAGSSSGTTS
ncbi:hypothetical protein ABPG75_002929 [Micractinium tetrahymenae]